MTIGMYLPRYSRSEDWDYSELAAGNPQRADLERKPGEEEIFLAVVSAFSIAVETSDIRFAMESATPPHTGMRVVFQFHVGEKLFNQFFNAQNGYRGQFWRGWEAGLRFKI